MSHFSIVVDERETVYLSPFCKYNVLPTKSKPEKVVFFPQRYRWVEGGIF